MATPHISAEKRRLFLFGPAWLRRKAESRQGKSLARRAARSIG